MEANEFLVRCNRTYSSKEISKGNRFYAMVDQNIKLIYLLNFFCLGK